MKQSCEKSFCHVPWKEKSQKIYSWCNTMGNGYMAILYSVRNTVFSIISVDFAIDTNFFFYKDDH
jgi:hypothetical protein